MLTPNPNECNSTLMSETRDINLSRRNRYPVQKSFKKSMNALKCRQTQIQIQIGIQTQIRKVPNLADKSQNIGISFQFKASASLSLSNFPKSF